MLVGPISQASPTIRPVSKCNRPPLTVPGKRKVAVRPVLPEVLIDMHICAVVEPVGSQPGAVVVEEVTGGSIRVYMPSHTPRARARRGI